NQAALLALDAWWAEKTLADVNGANCRAYVGYRTAQAWKAARPERTGRAPRMVSTAAPRRELEDFRAAINHHRSEGPLLRDRFGRAAAEEWLARAMAYARRSRS